MTRAIVGPGGGLVGPGGGLVGPNPGTTASAGAATGTGAALAPEMTSASAGIASGTGAALNATITTPAATQAAAASAAGTGSAKAATTRIKATAGSAAGTGAAITPTITLAYAAYAGVARGTGTAYNPSRYQPRTSTTATGNPAYPWNLFRGQVIVSDVERIGSLLKVTLQLSDYNRLWPAMKLGAPQEGNFLMQPDGTAVAIDPNALNYGDGPGDGGVFREIMQVYWPIGPYVPFPNLVTHVHTTNPDYSGLPVIDWTIALSDVGSFLSDFASRQTGATRFWIDADMNAHWTTVGPTPFEADFRIPAPFEIDMDGPIQSGNVIQAMSLTVSADHSNLRRRAYVRGGTPESSIWVNNDGRYFIAAPTNAGEEYIDAPGAVTRDDAVRIAEWWFRWNLRTLLTGTAHINGPGPEAGGHDGWRVGQSVIVSDEVLSRLDGLPLDQYESIITGVTGHLVSPGEGLGIEIDENILGVDIGARVTNWQSLTWTEKGFGEAGTATLTIEIIDGGVSGLLLEASPGDEEVTLSWEEGGEEGGEELVIRPLADVRIFTDGSAAIEYDLEWGDVAGGALSSQLAKLPMPEMPEFVPPAYKVIWSGDKLFLPVGGSTNIYGQLSAMDNSPVPLPGVPIEVELLQWTDLTETVVGTGFTLASSGTDLGLLTTNAAGQVYDILQRGEGTATVAFPNGQALPIP